MPQMSHFSRSWIQIKG